MQPHNRTAHYQQFRRMLNDQRRSILKSVRQTVHAEREQGAAREDLVQDVPEISDANVQSSIDFSLAEIRSEALANINLSLDRLEGGEYGICIDCDDEIPFARLRALPFATRCRNCAEVHEYSHRHPQLTWHEFH